MYGGSHGDHATQVFIELCEMVEEAIGTLEEAGKRVPQPLSQHELGKNWREARSMPLPSRVAK